MRSFDILAVLMSDAHALSAIVVLYIARFHCIEKLGTRAGLNDSETVEIDRGIAAYRATFERARVTVPQSTLRAMAARCIRVIDMLADVERERRAGGGAESIGDLLRRITSLVNSEPDQLPIASGSNVVVSPLPGIDDGLFGMLTGPSYMAPDGLDAVQYAAREWGTYWSEGPSFGSW